MSKKRLVLGISVGFLIVLAFSIARVALRDQRGLLVYDIVLPGATFLRPGESEPQRDEMRVILNRGDSSLLRGEPGETHDVVEAWLAELWPEWRATEFLAKTSIDAFGTRVWAVEMKIDRRIAPEKLAEPGGVSGIDPQETQYAWLFAAHREGGPQIGTVLRMTRPEIDMARFRASELEWLERLQLGVPARYSMEYTVEVGDATTTER